MHGDIKSLTKENQKKLEYLRKGKFSGNEFVDLDILRVASEISAEQKIKLGLLVNRRGHIEWMIVGDAHKLYLPDLGRVRGGDNRLRGLRLVVLVPDSKKSANSRGFFRLKGQHAAMHQEFVTDLEKLRLDAVVQISSLPNGGLGDAILAKIDPEEGSNEEYFSSVEDLNQNYFDFPLFITDLETDIASAHKQLWQKKDLRQEKDVAVLVGAYTSPRKVWQSSMGELEELTKTAGVQIVEKITQQRKRLDPKTVVGSGKLEDICLKALHEGADMVIFDCELSPSQLNAITDMTDLKILDRTMIILDIFAKRATTMESKLQVELAQLRYSQPRLAKKQTGLSRLSGGIGGTGPGETKLQVDKRRVRDRISKIEKEVQKVLEQRKMRRERRVSRDVPVIAIVGYTNAGKSTLLNALTKSHIYVKNELFATLDPTSRRLRFPQEREVIISDTVGFIRDLPKGLAASFQATLEELHEADLLLHVIDGSDPDHLRHIDAVQKVLADLELTDKKQILVLNKVDLMDPKLANIVSHKLFAVPISAQSKAGLNDLLIECEKMLW